MHIKSWHSIDDNFLPFAFWKISTEKLNRLSNGRGPDDLPPNVFNLSPAGRTLDISHLGICPANNICINSLYAFAQPILESATTMVVSVSNNSSGTSGNFSTSLRSTENPTPVPHIKINKHSSNAFVLFTARYAQLYPATLSRSNASPAVINDLIEGMISILNTASSNSFLCSFIPLRPFKCFSKKSKYLFTVSSQVSLRFLSSSHRAYLLLCINCWYMSIYFNFSFNSFHSRLLRPKSKSSDLLTLSIKLNMLSQYPEECC